MLHIHNIVNLTSSKKHTQFKTRVLKPCPIYNQNGQNWYPLYDQNGWKTLPLGAAHTYIAHIREYPPPRGASLSTPQVKHFNPGFVLLWVFLLWLFSVISSKLVGSISQKPSWRLHLKVWHVKKVERKVGKFHHYQNIIKLKLQSLANVWWQW